MKEYVCCLRSTLGGPMHGRRSVGDWGGTCPPTFQGGGDSIGIVPPPLFSSEKLRGT